MVHFHIVNCLLNCFELLWENMRDDWTVFDAHSCLVTIKLQYVQVFFINK